MSSGSFDDFPGCLVANVARLAATQIAQADDTGQSLGLRAVENDQSVYLLVGHAPGRAGDAVSDKWITTKVRSTLIFSNDVPSRHLSVETRDGVVHLEGEVETERERERAIALAADVEGVARVNADRLEVVGS